MTTWSAIALYATSLLFAAVAGIDALRNRGPSLPALIGAGLTFTAVLVQVVVAVILTISGERAGSGGLFVGYLVALVLVVPAGVAWGRTERNKSGSLVLLVAGLVVSVLVLRLQDLWNA